MAIIGMLALLIGGCELLLRRKRLERDRAAMLHRLRGYPPPPDYPCPWPTLEPEVEDLRRKALL